MKRQQRIATELKNINNKEEIINKLPNDGKRIKSKSRFIQFFRSIRVKLMVSFFIPIIFIIILGVSAYISASNSIITNFTDTTISMIQSSGNYYSVVMQVIEDKILNLSDDSDMKQYYSGSSKSNPKEVQYLLNIKKNFSDISLSDAYIKNLGIIADYGSSVSSLGIFGEENLYKEFSTTEEATTLDSSYDVTWTGYHNFLDEQLKLNPEDYAISISNKFVDKYGDQIGVLQMDLRMNVVVDTLKSMDLPKDSIAAFISPDGREITSDGTSKKPIFSNKSFYKKAIKGKETSGHKTVDYNGLQHLFIYSKIGNTGAVIAALVPSSSLMSQASDIKYQTAFIVIIATIIAGIIGVNISSGIDAVIKKIIGILSKASNGDLTVSVKTNRKDEFLILSDSINNMISHMKKLITKASGVGNTVITSADYVAQNTELLLTAAQDISTAIQNIQQGIIQQASDTEQCLRQTDELANQIHLVHDNSDAIEKIVYDTKNVVKDGIGEVDELSNATKANLQITAKTIKDIEELETESNSITEIIAVINDISSKTNLLSLNASIEAARAGNAGRGFSVVAEEIRKLSENTLNSATKIEAIIHKISAKTQATVQTVKQAEVIATTTETRLQNVILLFNNINIRVNDLAVKMNKIAIGMKEIDRAKNDTLSAIESISAVAEETSAASEEVDATAFQQLEAVAKLNEAAKLLENDATELETSIQLFRI